MLAGAMFGLPSTTHPIALALQGGGAHGAYTWGVLDALLAHTGHPIAAVSGTSAGAVNAVVMAHGLLHGGRDGAREALGRFWTAMGDAVPWDALGLVAGDGQRWSTAGRLMLRWSQALPFVPAQRVDPLAQLLAQQVDFERLRSRDAPRLHVAATHANSGRLRVFGNDELSAEVVLASACLPALRPAVQLAGEPYWDGGFSANPAVHPLVHGSRAADLVLVLLSPRLLGPTPDSPDAVRLRAMEIGFNAGFLREMHAFAQATALARRGWWPGALERRLRRLRWHLIDGDDALSSLPADSKMIAHPQSLARLREAGFDRTRAWIDEQGRLVGRRDSVDLQRLFGDSPLDV